VLHLASVSNWDDIHSPLMDDVVVKGSQNVLKAAQACGNLRMVYVSSVLSINGTQKPILQDEKSVFTLTNRKDYSYAFAKHEVEQHCLKAAADGLPVVIVNPTDYKQTSRLFYLKLGLVSCSTNG